MDLTDDRYCFACGPENPIGLNMKLNYKQNKVTVEFIPKKEHQGWHNMVHGGILFTLMDEAMAKLIIEQGDMVVTSRMDTRFLRPARVDEKITITGKIDEKEEKKFKASCKIKNEAGKTLASSKAVYVKVS